MIRLVLIVLGFDYLRRRSAGMYWIGLAFVLSGFALLVDSLDDIHRFPLSLFAGLLVVGGVGAFAGSAFSTGPLRIGRIVERVVFVAAASLVLTGHQSGGFWLSMILGSLFLVDGLLQCISAVMVRYPRWRGALVGGVCEIAVAITFYAPYPFGYTGTVPYAMALALIFIGWGMVWLGARVRLMASDTSVDQINHGALFDAPSEPGQAGAGALPAHATPASADPVLVVHVWTPQGAARQVPLQRARPLITRYVAAVDVNGAVWTGHVALESPDAYISLDPAAPIKRSLGDLRVLHAAEYNNVPAHFQTDYAADESLRRRSTVQVRIRNFDPVQLQRFWLLYGQDTTYNLTRRNCAASVARALEAALEGAVRRVQGREPGWRAFVGLLLTPELWVAAQIRKRGKTMAWTPGLVLDYARSLGVLVDPPSTGWTGIGATTRRRMRRLLGQDH